MDRVKIWKETILVLFGIEQPKDNFFTLAHLKMAFLLEMDLLKISF